MALRRFQNDLKPFPGPNRTSLFYPNVYRDYRIHPYYAGRTDIRTRHVRDDREYRQRRAEDLLDKSIEAHGDLGWPLDFATAWCYKFIIGNQTQVTDVVDRIRELEDVEEKTPYMIFDLLDKAVFDGKLKGMVHLRWKPLATSTCGRTSAPGVATGIARICIDLNSTLFDEEDSESDGDIDELLDALIHQMIHAFFLVCCGAQPKSAKPDGRLADGLHFGVILRTILEVTKRCEDGPLPLIFYADSRRKTRDSREGQARPRQRQYRSWLAIDPRGSGITAPPADGQSHCDHDNRRIRSADLKNWQVEKCALALDLESSERGDVIYNFEDDGQLVPTDRLKGPPSSTYVELIWTDKRIMITREKSLKFSSLKKPIERQGKMELKVPDCSLHVLHSIWLFLNNGHYWQDPAETVMKHHSHRHGRNKGPPILVESRGIANGTICGVLDHIKIFKTAESMKFEELQVYSLKRLYNTPATSDEPIEILKELYNDGKDKGKPIHAELHKWARKFLTRCDNTIPAYEYYAQGLGNAFRGTSNYEKIVQICGERFENLYHRNMALKDDCKLVWAELSVGAMSDETLPGSWGYGAGHFPSSSGARGSILPRRNSWSNFNTIDWPQITQLGSTPASVSTESLHDIGLGSTYPRPLLDYAVPYGFAPSVSLDYHDWNGDLKILTGERDTTLPILDNGKGIELTV